MKGLLKRRPIGELLAPFGFDLAGGSAHLANGRVVLLGEILERHGPTVPPEQEATPMRKTLVAILAAALLSLPAPASAHPHRCPVIVKTWPAPGWRIGRPQALRCPDWRQVQLR